MPVWRLVLEPPRPLRGVWHREAGAAARGTTNGRCAARGAVAVDDTAGIEAVARWLCLASEYHAQNWRLYLPKARDVIDTYTKAMASAESVD
jgi:hypothetical protein